MRPLKTQSVDDVIDRLTKTEPPYETYYLPRPQYHPPEKLGPRLVLGVSSMKDHMTDEGWQLTHGLSQHGYIHCGHGLPEPCTHVPTLLNKYSPSVVVVQDKREWLPTGDFRDQNAVFTDINVLAERHDIFKLTVIKDAQQRPGFHRASADEIGCHAWIHYYHPSIVHHLQPYIRPMDLIRTWHTVDATALLGLLWSTQRQGAILSGAISSAYPLRQRIANGRLPIHVLRHPGYHRRGCATKGYVQTLAGYKVAICTASKYGYSLRKMVEATVAGCIVVTDLPVDEKLPFGTDANLVRIHPNISMQDLGALLKDLEAEWNNDVQQAHAENALWGFDYHRVTGVLAQMIEVHRQVQASKGSK